MSKKIKIGIAILILLLVGMVVSHLFSTPLKDKPKLVIGIIVDQMRAEYLHRFESNYTENGFKRLLREGFQVKNTHYNYIPTATAPGHTSIFSGTTPANHGIISNSWYDRRRKSKVYCAEDDSVDLVDMNGIIKKDRSGRSPKNLLVTNIADELSLFTNGRSKIIGISFKDRGAIFPSGHMADYAFWYNSNSGNFITSTYYADKLPDWLVAFNSEKKADSLLSLSWDTLLKQDRYVNSVKDNASFEKIFKGNKSSTFPYDLKALKKENGNYALLSEVPYGNTLLTQMAKATIKGENLEKGMDTNFLTVSYSSTDYVGHNFGIRSKELEDTYVRLDREIAELLKFLDENIGEDNYTLFLTADHAASDNPEYLKANRLPGGFFDSKEIGKKLDAYLSQRFGKSKYVEYIDYTQINLNDKSRFDQEVLKASVVFLLENGLGIKEAYAPNLFHQPNTTSQIQMFFKNTYNSLNSGDILLNFWSGWMETRSYGTTHGNLYNSDTHVPLVWYGKNIQKGETVVPYTITQIAPTLSFLLDIPLSSASSKHPILEMFK